MVISWKPPLDDGGSEISNYIIEKRDTKRDLWVTVTSASTKTTCKVPKLTEGREYIMRIFAENMYGISDPLESEEMRAKDLFSKNHLMNLKGTGILQTYVYRCP